MKTIHVARMLFAGVLLAGMTGCAMFNYTKGTMQYSRATTIGRELIDLKEARDKGALTDSEYNQCKKDLMSRHAVATTNAVTTTAEK